MRVVYIRWDAIKVVLSSRPFVVLLSSSLALFHPVPFFLPLHSLLFISFASLLSLLAHVYTSRPYIRREVSFAGPRYIYEAPPPLMVSMCSDATRTCPARSACAHTRASGDSSCVRARERSDPARRAIRRAGQTRKEGFTHTHTHGCELCLARDVKLLAIS